MRARTPFDGAAPHKQYGGLACLMLYMDEAAREAARTDVGEEADRAAADAVSEAGMHMWWGAAMATPHTPLVAPNAGIEALVFLCEDAIGEGALR